MSTSYYLVCDEHREVNKVSYHRAIPPGADLWNGATPVEATANFCCRHIGCNLRVVNEHNVEPWDYADAATWWADPDESGDVPHADVMLNSDDPHTWIDCPYCRGTGEFKSNNDLPKFRMLSQGYPCNWCGGVRGWFRND